MTQTTVPAAPSTNALQRWVLGRSAGRYAKLSPELRPIAIGRDRFLFSRRARGLWAGMFCGIAGGTLGLAASSPNISVWLAFFLVLLIFAGLVRAGLSAWLRPERFTGKRLWHIALVVLAATYAGAIVSFHGRLSELITQGEPWYTAALLVMWRATPMQLMIFIAAILVLFVISMARGEFLQRALNQARVEHERDAAERQLTQARLSLLQAQIQPHFLFNTLAAMQHWVDVSDERAGPLLRALTMFLRGSTELMSRNEVTLLLEVAMVRHYLEIMQARLGTRLLFAIDVPVNCEQQTLPPGLVITLVENAVQHGIEPALHGGELKLVARRTESVFELRVLDDGVGLPAAGLQEGVGLTNSRQRLHHRFGELADLQLSARRDGSGTEARLRVFSSADSFCEPSIRASREQTAFAIKA